MSAVALGCFVLGAGIGVALDRGTSRLRGSGQATHATHPSPTLQRILAEDFSDDGWRLRWREELDGTWRTAGGRLHSDAGNRGLLILRQRLTTPVAIEYTGRIDDDAKPGDLSIWWSESDRGADDPEAFATAGRSWRIQAGAYDNRQCTIMSIPGDHRLAHHALALERGRDYRFRVELDGESMTMSIDGTEVLRARDRLPTTSGHLALYGYYAGKSFDDVVIYQRPDTGLVPATAMGDALLAAGNHLQAAAAYGRVAAAGGPQSQQAWLRKGLAERLAGQPAASRDSWAMITDPDLAASAAAMRLADLVATGQHDLFIDRFAEQWQARPSAREDLRIQWQRAVADLSSAPYPDGALVERYLDLRRRTMPDDPSSAMEATDALFRIGRLDEIIDGFPHERGALIKALICTGRLDEAERQPDLLAKEQCEILIARGEYAQAVLHPGIRQDSRVVLLAKMGRGSEVVAAAQRLFPVAIHEGRADEAIAKGLGIPFEANAALVAAGRIAEAAGSGDHRCPGSGNDWRAHLLLGHLDQAESARGYQLADMRLIRSAETGDAAGLARWRPLVPWPDNLGNNAFWFSGAFAAPFIDQMQGDRNAMRRAMERVISEREQVQGRRPWLLARRILGLIDDGAVLAMPARTEGEAWLRVAVAMQHELEGRAAEALQSYQAFTSLPMHQRLLDMNTVDHQVEWFVAWRIRALAK